MRLLRRISLQPQPFYSASSNGNTARLFTKAHIPDLKREVRKILMEGCLEADLRSSQLAICAWLWRIDPLLRLLFDQKNIWNYLFSNFELREQHRSEAKRIFKKALYSICFGMAECHLNWCVQDCSGWTELGRIIASRFLDIPLIRDLLSARSFELDNIARAGGGTTCYGKWLKVNEEVHPRDILAQVAQSWEMKLIFPAFELADKTEDFKIMIFQHDGFSVHFTRRPEDWRKRIQGAVENQARQLGIPTSLEWDKIIEAAATQARSRQNV